MALDSDREVARTGAPSDCRGNRGSGASRRQDAGDWSSIVLSLRGFGDSNNAPNNVETVLDPTLEEMREQHASLFATDLDFALDPARRIYCVMRIQSRATARPVRDPPAGGPLLPRALDVDIRQSVRGVGQPGQSPRSRASTVQSPLTPPPARGAPRSSPSAPKLRTAP
jgi:hypothetical protein